MFTLNTGLDATNVNGGGGLVFDANQNTAQPLTTVAPFVDATLNPTNAVGTNTAGVITANIGTGLNPLRIRVGDRVFFASDNETPDVGDFNYNRDTGEVVINTDDDSVDFVFFTEGPTFDFVPGSVEETNVPSILQTLNATGNIVIRRQFLGHPSATLTFVTNELGRPLVNSAFRRGRVIRIRNIGFVVGQTQISVGATLRDDSALVSSQPTTASVTERRMINVEVQLIGRWAPRGTPSRSELDRQLNLKDLAGSRDRVSLSRVASAAGFSLAFSSGLNIVVRPELSGTEQITPRNEIERRAAIVGRYPYYSDSGAVVLLPWGRGRTIKDILDRDVIQPKRPVFSRTGQGTVITGTPLLQEFRNARLRLESSSPTAAGTGGFVVRFEYENAVNATDVRSPNFGLVAGGVVRVTTAEDLADLSAVFDNGGPTKTEIEITEYFGEEVQRIVRRFGFVYASDDIYTVQLINGQPDIQLNRSANVAPFWQQYETYTSVYQFRADGYRVRRVESGTKTARLKKETTALEAANLQGQILLQQTGTPQFTALTGEKAAFEFNEQVPINRITRLQLNNLRNFYPDYEPIDTQNPDSVEPLYVARQLTIQDQTIVRADPANPTAPPLSIRDRSLDESVVTITSVNPELFTVSRRTESSQGTNGLENAEFSEPGEFEGRPEIAKRITLNPPQSATPLFRDNSGVTYFLNTPNSDPTRNVFEGTVSYPDVDQPSVGRRAAATEISIRNADAETTTLVLNPELAFDANINQEGALVRYYFRDRVVLATQETAEISLGTLKVTNFQVDLGIFIAPPVSIDSQPA